MKRWIIFISILLVIALAILGGYAYFNKDELLGYLRLEEKEAEQNLVEEKVKEPTLEEKLNAKAEEYLKQMTLDEKIGQLFLVRFPTSEATKLVSKYHMRKLLRWLFVF